ncbi:MAG: aminotransferase class V-fold PLP-dependent enzyme [Gammaproteobacteria bacterium]
MRMSRRSLLKTAGAVSAIAWQGGTSSAAQPNAKAPVSASSLPDKAAFAKMSVAHLDSGGTHPVSLGAKRAVEEYLNDRTLLAGTPHFGVDATGERVRARFARLIGAKPEEICLVPSTTAGEHLMLQALNLPAAGGRIVTDTLHFPGSMYLYDAMSRAAMDVVWLKPRDGRSISLADVDAAVTKQTRVVVLSLVSAVNGFQQDLKQVCEIAHAKGALVYADIVQAAGAVAVDVRASGVDFAACAAYKWLMGDYGLGFMFVREELLEQLRRTQFGYYQLAGSVTHVYPFDPPGRAVADFEVRRDATGHFATGTTSGAGIAHLDYSLEYVERLGVQNIQRYRQPLLDYARKELERRGYRCMTPVGSTSPILSFLQQDAEKLRSRLEAADVKVTLADNRFRISTSVFNDVADIDRLLEALA